MNAVLIMHIIFHMIMLLDDILSHKIFSGHTMVLLYDAYRTLLLPFILAQFHPIPKLPDLVKCPVGALKQNNNIFVIGSMPKKAFLHSSEINGLCLMKCPSKLPYFWNTKTHVDFLIFIWCYFMFFPNECRHYRSGHLLGKK